MRLLSSKLLLLTVGIVLLTACLRLVNLNWLPVFADESIYIRWSQVMKAEGTLRFLPLSDGKQPLFMWLLMPVLKLIQDPLIAGRTLSAMSGIGTVIGVAVAAYLIFKSARPALMAGLIYATIPFAVFFDRLALVDGLLVLFLVWSFVFFWIAIEKQRLDAAMISGFFLGFAWLTKSPAIFGFILLPLVLLISKPKNLGRSFLLICPTFVIALGLYSILRLGPEFHMIALRNKDYVFSLSEVITHPLDPLTSHLKEVVNFYLHLGTPLGLLLAICGVLAGGWQHWRSKLILALWWLVPLGAESLVAKTFTARYILPSLPFAVLLMVHALEHLGQKTKKHILVWAGLGLVVVPGLIQDVMLITNPAVVPMPRVERSGYLEQWTAGYGIREVAQQVKEYAKAGPVIVGSEGFFGTPFSGLQMYLNDTPNVRIVGVGVWVDKVHDNLANALEDNQVFLVVNSSRFHIDDPSSLGLQLIASYPKAQPPEGDTEYLLFFKVNAKTK